MAFSIRLETEDDLFRLINDKVTESLHLDFKRCDALSKKDEKRKELSKDVVAFATAEGGILLYGIIEDEETHEAKEIDNGYDPSDISKEWIEQVIDSRVSPRIEGIRINAIELTTKSPGKYAYAVIIPASVRAPHMAADKRYYMRQNFQSVPMEDYQVRDVMFRRKAPHLESFCRLIPGTDYVVIRFGIRNIGLVAAEDIYLEVEFVHSQMCPFDWTPMSYPPVVSLDEPLPGTERTTHILRYIQTDVPQHQGFRLNKRLPKLIYPGVEISLEELILTVRNDALLDSIFTVRLYARDMPVVEKHIKVLSIFSGLQAGVTII